VIRWLDMPASKFRGDVQLLGGGATEQLAGSITLLGSLAGVDSVSSAAARAAGKDRNTEGQAQDRGRSGASARIDDWQGG